MGQSHSTREQRDKCPILIPSLGPPPSLVSSNADNLLLRTQTNAGARKLPPPLKTPRHPTTRANGGAVSQPPAHRLNTKRGKRIGREGLGEQASPKQEPQTRRTREREDEGKKKKEIQMGRKGTKRNNGEKQSRPAVLPEAAASG